jgi:hypothetical protein
MLRELSLGVKAPFIAAVRGKAFSFSVNCCMTSPDRMSLPPDDIALALANIFVD